MTAPSTIVTLLDSTPPQGADLDTAKAFVVGITEKGSTTTLTEITSMSDYDALLGDSTSYDTLYDELDAAFHEGLKRVFVARVVGPAAVKSSANIYDQSGSLTADASFVATAVNPGVWGDKLNVVTTYSGGSYTLSVTHDDDGVLVAASEAFTTLAQGITWAGLYASDYITLALGASTEVPRAATTSLASGADDRASITSTHWANALALFTADLGPGQIYAPGQTASAILTAVQTQAANTKRVCFLDGVDTATVATLTSAAAAQVSSTSGKWSKFSGAWAVVPGVLAGTERTVPWNALELGITARNDGEGKSVNQPAAGAAGVSRYAIRLSQAVAFTDAQRATLDAAGVNVPVMLYNKLRGMGNATLASRTAQPNDQLFSNARLRMAIAAKAWDIGQAYVQRMMDGQKHVQSDYQGDLIGVCRPYFNEGALYGASEAEAFAVDVDSVNTPTTIAAGELHAVIALRDSPAAKVTYIDIVNKSITEAVA